MIVVLGAGGQLGQCLKKVFEPQQNKEVQYLTSSDLDITSPENLDLKLGELPVNSVIINCAAYTAVDNAEDDQERCELINHFAVKYLAKSVKKFSHQLIHISTDYVFDGTHNFPYTEKTETSPIGTYGKTKALGEKEIQATLSNYLIIRTSWLYSEFNNNFVKSIFKLASERKNLNIVADQIGSPTYALDLAYAISEIIPQLAPGQKEILHFSNEGIASWYDFAYEIVKLKGLNCKVSPIETKDYPTKAERPTFSVLNKKKIKEMFNINIHHWKESLSLCLQKKF